MNSTPQAAQAVKGKLLGLALLIALHYLQGDNVTHR